MKGAGGMWELSAPSSQFCCEHKTGLKNKVYFKKYTYIYGSVFSTVIYIHTTKNTNSKFKM